MSLKYKKIKYNFTNNEKTLKTHISNNLIGLMLFYGYHDNV